MLLIYGSMFATCVIAAVESIEVNALLGTKALIVIDGQRRLLAEGERSEEGVMLVSVEEEGVMLEVNGETTFFSLGSSRVGTKFSRPEKVVERVYRDNEGMYRTAGSINGHIVGFLVDTGATSIAFNSHDAKRLGINYLLEGVPTTVNTAAGAARAWAVKLDRVTVGQITLHNIPAMVLDGSSPSEVLLGMSFLERLNVQHQGEVMVLETKF